LPPASSNLPGSWPQARRPEGGTGSPRTTPLFGLAPHGVFRASAVAAGAVRSYRTISPLPQSPSRRMIAEAVYFLLHFPSRRRASPLASMLPVGARTFLSGQTPKGSPKRPPGALQPGCILTSFRGLQFLFFRKGMTPPCPTFSRTSFNASRTPGSVDPISSARSSDSSASSRDCGFLAKSSPRSA